MDLLAEFRKRRNIPDNIEDNNKAVEVNNEEVPAPFTKPYFETDGDLVIPFNSDPKYHWWRGGQSISETISEFTIQEAIK